MKTIYFFVNNKNLRDGNLKRAIRDFKHVGYEIAPGHAMSVYCLGQAYYRNGDLEEATVCFNEARISSPEKISL